MSRTGHFDAAVGIVLPGNDFARAVSRYLQAKFKNGTNRPVRHQGRYWAANRPRAM